MSDIKFEEQHVVKSGRKELGVIKKYPKTGKWHYFLKGGYNKPPTDKGFMTAQGCIIYTRGDD